MPMNCETNLSNVSGNGRWVFLAADVVSLVILLKTGCGKGGSEIVI